MGVKRTQTRKITGSGTAGQVGDVEAATGGGPVRQASVRGTLSAAGVGGVLTSMMSGCLRTGSIGIGVGRERNKEREGEGRQTREREGGETNRLTDRGEQTEGKRERQDRKRQTRDGERDLTSDGDCQRDSERR